MVTRAEPVLPAAVAPNRLTMVEADAAALRAAAEAVLDAWTIPSASWTPLDDAIATLGGMLMSVTIGARLLTEVEIGRDAVALLRALADRTTLTPADRVAMMALLRRARSWDAAMPSTERAPRDADA